MFYGMLSNGSEMSGRGSFPHQLFHHPHHITLQEIAAASPVASREWLAGVVICSRLKAYCWVAVLLTWSL
jgi:hypothetical protein